MKLLILVLIIIAKGSFAFAGDNSSRCIIGGRYVQSDVERAIEEQVMVQSVAITKSKWSLETLNPLSWTLAWKYDFRVMSLIFSNHNSLKHFTNCSAVYDRDQKYLYVNECDEIDASIGFVVSLKSLPACP